MSDVAPEPATTRPRAGDRIIERIENELSSHKQHTTDELASMKRELQDLLAATKREDASFKEEVQSTLKAINEYIAELKTADDQRKANSDNTIVVPPGDVKPVVPDAEPPPNLPGEDKPRRSWKDWF